MSKKAKTSKSSSKERGLNVKIVQEEKAPVDSKVRVNNNFGSKTSGKSSKKTNTSKNNKKTFDIKTSKNTQKKVEKKSANDKKTEEKVTNDKKIEKKATKTKKENKLETEKKVEKKQEKSLKKPASFSKNLKTIKESKTPEIILPKKSDETTHFETLSINTTLEKPTSKIIKRDVAKTEDSVEKQSTTKITQQSAKVSEEKPIAKRKETSYVVDKTPEKKLSAREFKEQEIKKAITTATKLPKTDQKRSRKFNIISQFGWARITLMVTCAATAAFALVYFIDLASNDMSLKVVATQSGIEASYPEYIPRGYELSDVTSASGKVTMNYKSEEGAFVFTEESTSWDSTALLNNYIRENYADDEYAVITEQGLTIYMGNNWEAWVNGGILYKLSVKSGSLTKKQMKTIATSL